MSKKLAEEKELVLNDNENNIKVIAGPGSGKTKLIVEKIKRLVYSGVEPEKILAITYTEKAANELEQKISHEIPDKKGFYISTIHGFCSRFMKENLTFFENYRGYKILDELEQFFFILKHHNDIRANGAGCRISELKDYFGRIKDNYTIEEIKQKGEHNITEQYLKYCEKLNLDKKLDFGDLINVVIDRIEKDKKLANIASKKFDYLFIDEYQDVNKRQERLIELFHNENNYIMIVGDINQSIYGFRGADVSLFDEFDNKFNKYRPVKEYRLRTNFRSTKKIIEITNRFFSISEDKKIIGNDDPTVGDISSNGDKPEIIVCEDETHEAREVVKYIKELREKKLVNAYSDIAILFKSVKRDAKKIIDEMDKNGMRYEVIGDGTLFEKDYIRELIDSYNYLSEEKDIRNEFLQINIKKDSETYKKLITSTSVEVLYILFENSDYIKNIFRKDDEKKIVNIARLLEVFSKQQQMFNSRNDHGKNIKNLKKLDKKYLDSGRTVKPDVDSVKIVTFHSSKGLEYPVVFISNLNKNNGARKDHIAELFPEYNSSKDAERAFYVAMTRAMSLLTFSYHSPRDGEPEYIKKIKACEMTRVRRPEYLPFDTQENEMKILNKKFTEKKDRTKLSYYKIIEYLKCKYAYKLRFYYNLSIPFDGKLTYGSDIHTLLYHINKNINSKKINRIEDILEKIPEKYRDKCKKNNKKINDYISKFKEEMKYKLNPELPFNHSIKDVDLDGRIDLLINFDNKQCSIVEFKSGNKSENLIKNTKKQIEVYAKIMRTKGYKKINGIMYFFGDGYKREFSIGTKDIDKLDKELNEVINGICNEDFEPTQDKKMCETCIFSKKYKICPYNKNDGQKQSIDEDIEYDCDAEQSKLVF